MKHTIGIVLLCSLLLPTLGMYGWIQYKKVIIRSEVKLMMMAELNKDVLELLTFTREESENLEWEHSREFEFEGRMYDVVETRHHGEFITYVCWPDHRESELNKQLDELARNANQSDQDQNNGNHRLLSFFKNFYTENSSESSIAKCPQRSKATDTKSYSLESAFREIDSPPPRYC